MCEDKEIQEIFKEAQEKKGYLPRHMKNIEYWEDNNDWERERKN